MPKGKYDESINETILSILGAGSSSIRFLQLRDKVSAALSRPGLSYETFNKHLNELVENRLVSKEKGRHGGYYLLQTARKKTKLGILGSNEKERFNQRVLAESLLFAAKHHSYSYVIRDLPLFLNDLGIKESEMRETSVRAIEGYAQFILGVDSMTSEESRIALLLFEGELLRSGPESLKHISSLGGLEAKEADWQAISKILCHEHHLPRKIRQVRHEPICGITIISDTYRSFESTSEFTNHICDIPGVSIRDFLESREGVKNLPTEAIWNTFQTLLQHNIFKKILTLGGRDRFVIADNRLYSLLREILLINKIEQSLWIHHLRYHRSEYPLERKRLWFASNTKMNEAMHDAEITRQTYEKLKTKNNAESIAFQDKVNRHRERLEEELDNLVDRVRERSEMSEFSFLDDALKLFCPLLFEDRSA